MGVFYFEGFETIGTETGNSNRATVQARLTKRFTSFGVGINGFLIPDSELEGYAWVSRSASQVNNAALIYHFPDDIVAAIARNSDTMGVEPFEHIMGFRLHTRNTTVSQQIWAVVQLQSGGVTKSSGGCLNMVIVDGTDIQIRRGSTVLHTEPDVLQPGDWNYIEIRFKISDVTGVNTEPGLVIVHVNGVEVINLDDVDTDSDLQGTTGLDYVGFELTGNGGDGAVGSDYWAFDDIYCLFPDGAAPYDDFLGPVRVRRFELDGDIDTEWTPSTEGTHYTLVDENGNSSTDYVESDTDGQVDSYTMANFDGGGTIYAIKAEAEAINTVGGTPNLILSVDDVSTTNVVDNTGSSKVVTAYKDVAGFDDSEVGIQFDNGF